MDRSDVNLIKQSIDNVSSVLERLTEVISETGRLIAAEMQASKSKDNGRQTRRSRKTKE